MLNLRNKYAPDVLDCIANLSSDEVFTSPKLANQMLDMVPQELFTNPRTKFLDPCCKSGVFLREIVKRLDKGLEDIIPDRQQRIDHILHKQVFGIAITELTAQLSRRTVYCSKYACAMQSGDVWISDENDDEHGIHETHSYSISEFTAEDVNDFCINPIQGNVRFNNQIKHNFDKNGTCKICGANKKSFDEHSHAYELIHINETRLEALKNMQWDLIIGNPPYQLADGNTDSGSASPIYNIFVEQAKKLQPRYLTMIIPSRWMAGGKGLNDFRESMINDKHITQLHDFIKSEDCFSGVAITGGVCYFLREKDREDKCVIVTHNADSQKTSTRYLKEDGVGVFIRQSELIDIKNKVWKDANQKSFADIVSARKPYGFCADFFAPKMKIDGEKKSVSAKEKYGIPDANTTAYEDGFAVYGLENSKRTFKYIPKDYPFIRKGHLDKYKIFMSKGNGSIGTIGAKEMSPIVGTPVIGKPNECCTETFLEVGGWDTEFEAIAAEKYIRTRFFRSLVAIMKQTQNMPASIYTYAPMQNFTEKSDIDWSKSVIEIEQQLYKKYGLSDEDILFIENNVAPMNESDVSVEEDDAEE